MTEQLSSLTAATPMAPRARDAIQAMAGYASARSLVGSNADMVFLDANECAFAPYVGARDLERYPEQQPSKLQAAICKWLDVSSQNLLIGRCACLVSWLKILSCSSHSGFDESASLADA